MSDKQPDALRLADELDRPYWDDGTPHGQHVKAAALLRTQHAAIERKDALLRQALEQMRDFSAIDICATQHHKKADRHSSIARCPVAERFRAVCFAITKELQ